MSASAEKIRLERTYPTSAERIWELLTTGEGLAQWWAMDGFTLEVQELDLRVGGELRYTMTVTDPKELEFAKANNLPLVIESRKTYTEVVPTTRLAYSASSTFVHDPAVEPYDFVTVVELRPTDDGVRVVLTADTMHSDEWTQRVTKSRETELDRLTGIVSAS
ncbi:SRPBCC domain-containing protein [Streptomyces sp. NPDC058464]|uniref:SRPBCC family protein n=1 Tax=Streptomyces sp. NPDC058464 TaxID=3346511 RepID=UPI003664BF3E